MRCVLIAVLSFAALTAAAQTCQVCGEIKSIREMGAAQQRRPPPPGAAVGPPQSDIYHGPVVGTVAQFSWERGGRSEGWSFGAAGTPEMQERLGETSYEITVQMDIGESRTLQRRDGNRFHVGQRVALRAGELEPR